ncbi:MAG: hypothetical protein ACI8S3_000535 [Alphaproteobacteria bacterium]
MAPGTNTSAVPGRIKTVASMRQNISFSLGG